jgi:HK97 gp10 family phage protein
MSEREVQRYFRDLPFAKKREIAEAVRDTAERIADRVRERAPEGLTGKTRQSVRVSRTRNELTFVVLAGGPLTTRSIGERTYNAPVNVGQGEDTSGRRRVAAGASVNYDYALAGEFGTSRQPAQPWFYPAGNEARADEEARLRDEIAEIIADG